jgi:hypothetical protein
MIKLFDMMDMMASIGKDRSVYGKTRSPNHD